MHTSATKRTASLALAATIGILGTGVANPFVATVSAQDATADYSTPPEVSTGPPGDNGGKPPKSYAPEKACVTGDLDNNIILQNKPWGQDFLQIEKVHNLLEGTPGGLGSNFGGDPLKVAVIDTGVADHNFFRQEIEGVGDYVDQAKNGREDCDGHGTEVAGIIAGDPNNPGIGFMGVAPEAKIVSIRQSSENYKPAEEKPAPPPAAPAAPPGPGGEPAPEAPAPEAPPAEGGEGEQPAALGSGSDGSTATAQEGGTESRNQDKGDTAGTVESLAWSVQKAADTPGVRVMNISINNCRPANGGQITGQEEKLQAAVKYAVEQKNVVVVSAAGNTSDETCKQNNQANALQPNSIVTPPWFADDVLSVAAIGKDGGVADFSVNGPWISVAAPGTEIISLDPAKKDALANQTIQGEGQAMPIQGTSFAAPYVTGLVALVRSKFPELNAREVMERIKYTAQHPGAPGGRDNFVGHGVVSPMAALTMTIPSEQGIPLAKPQQLPAELPPGGDGNRTPMIVAFAGAGGGVVALLITLFTVHTIRRNRDGAERISRGTA